VGLRPPGELDRVGTHPGSLRIETIDAKAA
jgi:hypothetical protein